MCLHYWELALGLHSITFPYLPICYAAYRLIRVPAIATTLTHYGNQLGPFVLIGLGGLILVDSRTLEDRGLTVLALVIGCLCLLHLLHNLGHLSLPNFSTNQSDKSIHS